MLKVLDLFSGIGGFSLGLERTGGFETIAFCEIDPFCRKVLAKHWPDVPIYDDVRGLEHGGPVDLICGGYPCQPFSQAGKRHGAEDDRHLWPAMFEVIQRHRPTWVVGENVAGHITLGLDEVLSDLEGEGYAVQAFVIPACAVDAPHRRDRIWIIAHTDVARHDRKEESRICEAEISEGLSDHAGDAYAHVANSPSITAGRLPERAPQKHTRSRERRENVSHPYSSRPPGQGGAVDAGDPAAHEDRQIDRTINDGGWLPEPAVGGGLDGVSFWMDGHWDDGIPRVAKGVPQRVDRLRSLGNTVVPQIPEAIGYAILEAERTE